MTPYEDDKISETIELGPEASFYYSEAFCY